MKFKDKFIFLLEKDIETPMEPAADISPDREAMASTLDDGITPEHYDVPAPRHSLNSDVKQKQLEELKHWITRFEKFAEFLNAPDAHSVQSKLHEAPDDTLFCDMSKTLKKKVSGLASELSSISEELKGHLIASND